MKPAQKIAGFIISLVTLLVWSIPGAFGFDYEPHNGEWCTTCHDMVNCSTPNIYCVPSTITTTNSGDKTVVFTSSDSQVRGEAPYDGICEVCHTGTSFHRNNSSGDHTHFADQKCTDCHLHGPMVMISRNLCYTCHGGDSGDAPEGNVPMFSMPYPGGESHNTHTKINSKGPNPALDCNNCHDTSDYSTFADGNPISTTTVCDTCHSPGGTYDGVDDAAIGAKVNWTDGVYSGSSLATGKEKWCAGCHDENPSIISGVAAPNVIGDEDGAYAYGIGWGYYGTGHGLAVGSYPASEAPAANIGCSDCHDYAISHIDGEHRTYSAAGDNYQSGYRLKLAMDVPRTDQGEPVSDFALCFDCHYSDPYLVQTDYNTNFREGLITNDHWRHLQAPLTGPFANGVWWDSDWDGAAGDSKISCTACHNVHGSPSPRMVRHGELISTPGTSDKVPSLNFKYVPTATYPTLLNSTGGMINSKISGGGSIANTGVCGMCHSNQDSYIRTPADLYPPFINGVYGEASSNVLIVDFSKGVYTDIGASGVLVEGDFSFTDNDDSRTITGVTHTAGDDIATILLSSALDIADDINMDTLAAATASSIYDASDNAMETTVVVVTSDTDEPTASALNPSNGASDVSIDTNLTLTLADSESGVDFTTFSITFAGDKGYSQTYSDIDTSVVSKSGTRKSYDVIVNPDVNFGTDEVITVTVNVDDHAASPLISPAWSFRTSASATPQTIALHPSGLFSQNSSWDTYPVSATWDTYLDTNDGDTTYAALCCTSPGWEFYVDMDDPAGLESATIQSITIHVYVRYRSSPAPGILPVAGDVNIGYRTGTDTVWKGNTTTDASGDYNLISSTAYTTDSDGGGLDLADINNLQIVVERNAAGSPQIRVTEVYAEITYIP